MVIECIGLPGSGKTFLFDKLSEELRQREVEYVNVSERCMNSILWKIGKKLARALIFLSGDARRYRDGMRKLMIVSTMPEATRYDVEFTPSGGGPRMLLEQSEELYFEIPQEEHGIVKISADGIMLEMRE